VLRPEEVARLINAAGLPFHRILLMKLCATGARRDEVAHLKVSDIDALHGQPHSGGKGHNDRESCPARSCSMNCAAIGAGCGESPSTGCFPATDGKREVILSLPRFSGAPFGRPLNAPATAAAVGRFLGRATGAASHRGTADLGIAWIQQSTSSARFRDHRISGSITFSNR
jgi:hypothetical protein